jgi:hypothetical protein
MKSWLAISAFDIPLATSRNTSSSRGVSSSMPAGVSVAGAVAANCSIRRRVIAGGEQRVSSSDHPHSCGELICWDVFEQESTGARAQGVVYVFVEVERGQYQYSRCPLAVDVDHLPGGLDAIELGHPDVHQDHIGAEFAGHRHRLTPVGRLADDFDVRLGVQDQAKAGPDQLLVISDQDTRAHAGTAPSTPRGSRRRSRPSPASSSPSQNATRSLIPSVGQA